MALENLIVDHKQISKGLLENILKGRVELIREKEGVNLTKEGHNLSNKVRVLLYLCGKKAWEFLNSKEIRVSIEEIEKNLGIKGNTLRPILKELRDSYQIDSEKGKYKISPKGIIELEKSLEHKKESYSEKTIKTKTLTLQINKSSNKISKGQFIKKLYDEGYFKNPKNMNDVVSELKKIGVSIKLTDLPSYLLSLVRNGKLSREQIMNGKRKIWVYKYK